MRFGRFVMITLLMKFQIKDVFRNIKTRHVSIGSNVKKYKALRNKGQMVLYIHRLVAKKFVPNPLNKPHVNHINRNTWDNSAPNLEWVTHAENIEHAKNSIGFQSGKKNRYKQHETIEILKLHYVYGLNFNEISGLYNRSKWSIRKVLLQTHHLHKATTL